MPARMTATARRQGAKNALICSVGVAIVWFLIAWMISLATGKRLWESGAIAFVLLCGGILLWFFAAWLFARKRGGKVLLDCGPHPSRKLFLLNAVLWFCMGPTLGLVSISASQAFAIAAPALGISFGLFHLVMATGRLQIREAGIWQYWSLLPWRRIESYNWTNDSTLLLKGNGALPSLRRGALPVPPEQQDAVDQLLQEYCAVRPTG